MVWGLGCRIGSGVKVLLGGSLLGVSWDLVTACNLGDNLTSQWDTPKGHVSRLHVGL